jgi:hypothetical protein
MQVQVNERVLAKRVDITIYQQNGKIYNTQAGAKRALG